MARNKMSEADRIILAAISHNIKKRTDYLNFSLKKLSEITGIKASTLSGYFTQRSMPDADKTQKIADALNVAKEDIDPRFLMADILKRSYSGADIGQMLKLIELFVALSPDNQKSVLNYASFLASQTEDTRG